MKKLILILMVVMAAGCITLDTGREGSKVFFRASVDLKDGTDIIDKTTTKINEQLNKKESTNGTAEDSSGTE